MSYAVILETRPFATEAEARAWQDCLHRALAKMSDGDRAASRIEARS